jgi:orotate phosphoribosyltransferase
MAARNRPAVPAEEGQQGDAAGLSPDAALGLFEAAGAILSGHFLLSSGQHSDTYVQKARVLERPDVAMTLAREIASWHRDVEVVLAPAVGAVALGFAVALASGARSVCAERDGGGMALRRGFTIEPGERTVVVEDVVTTGGSAAEVWALAGAHGAERLGVAALIDRTSSAVGFPLRAILRVDARAWDPSACPLCRDGVPVDSPGSRHLRTS